MVDGWNAFFCDDLGDLVSVEKRAGEGGLCFWCFWCERVLPRQHRVLSELQPNTESVGELWLGLLRFYTEEFDFKEHVISIRQKKRLTTFEKQWTSKCIAIEGAGAGAGRVGSRLRSAAPLTPLLSPSDPFDLNHNLGAGVSRKSEYQWAAQSQDGWESSKLMVE